MQPQMEVHGLQSAVKKLWDEGEDQLDGAAPGRFEFAVALYNPKWPIIKLNENSLAYLATVANVEDGPLVQIKQKGVLPDHEKVVIATLCLMMYSLASIELACNHASLSNPNLSITAFMHCVAAINTVLPGVEFKKREFLMSWLFYCKVLEENNVNISNLQSLYSELIGLDTP